MAEKVWDATSALFEVIMLIIAFNSMFSRQLGLPIEASLSFLCSFLLVVLDAKCSILASTSDLLLYREPLRAQNV